MAVFNSLVFNQASGKMGQVVLSRNGVARRRVTPSNPRTAPQMQARAGLAAANAAWKALTPVQRAGWTALAKQVGYGDSIGRTHNPTGRRLFIACCQRSGSAGQTPPATAPAVLPDVPGVAGFAVSVSPAGAGHPNGQIILTGDFAASGCVIVIRATPPYSPDRTAIAENEFRVLASSPSAIGPPTPDALAALYAARWGAPEAGMRIRFATCQVDANGFASAASRADATVGAGEGAGFEGVGVEMRRAA